MSMNEQQKRMTSAQSAAANARTPKAKAVADAKIVDIMSEKPRRG